MKVMSRFIACSSALSVALEVVATLACGKTSEPTGAQVRGGHRTSLAQPATAGTSRLPQSQPAAAREVAVPLFAGAQLGPSPGSGLRSGDRFGLLLDGPRRGVSVAVLALLRRSCRRPLRPLPSVPSLSWVRGRWEEAREGLSEAEAKQESRALSANGRETPQFSARNPSGASSKSQNSLATPRRRAWGPTRASSRSTTRTTGCPQRTRSGQQGQKCVLRASSKGRPYEKPRADAGTRTPDPFITSEARHSRVFAAAS